MTFTEEDVVHGYKKIKQSGERFLTASRVQCHGNFVQLDEDRGAKLITSEVGMQDELNSFYVSDFIDSPMIWIAEEGNKGRWIGIQGGWPPTREEYKSEMEYDILCIASDRRRYQNVEEERLIEFMEHERGGYTSWNTAIPQGWLLRAKTNFEQYKHLRKQYPLIPEFVVTWFVNREYNIC